MPTQNARVNAWWEQRVNGFAIATREDHLNAALRGLRLKHDELRLIRGILAELLASHLATATSAGVQRRRGGGS